MTQSHQNDLESVRVTLALLDSIERDCARSHRSLANELGIALGLTNAYVKRCAKKGFLKIRKASARNYAYYLTPQGFTEKSRLTAQYLTHSFSFFRHARNACSAAFRLVVSKCGSRVVLAGISDLAEIASLCAIEEKVEIVAIVDGVTTQKVFLRIPVVKNFDTLHGKFDAIIVTDLKNTRSLSAALVKKFGEECVVAPSLLDAFRREESKKPQSPRGG